MVINAKASLCEIESVAQRWAGRTFAILEISSHDRIAISARSRRSEAKSRLWRRRTQERQLFIVGVKATYTFLEHAPHNFLLISRQVSAQLLGD